MSVEPNAYAVLHVESDTPAEIISAAYRTLARRFHPDGPNPDPERMTRINQAYNEIKTTELRRRYDTQRRLVPVGPGRPVAPWAPTPAAAASDATPEAPGGASSSLRARIAEAQAPGQVIDFGTYAGWRVVDVARLDPDYLRWLSRHSSGARFRREIARCLPGDHEVGWSAKTLG